MLAATSETGWLSGRLERPWGVAEACPPAPRRPRLLDVVREALRVRHYSRRTERAYVGWIRRYVLFHGKRHPAEMGGPRGVAVSVVAGTRTQMEADDGRAEHSDGH
jgi:Phage integrase, N-terminal SAM-like domain